MRRSIHKFRPEPKRKRPKSTGATSPVFRITSIPPEGSLPKAGPGGYDPCDQKPDQHDFIDHQSGPGPLYGMVYQETLTAQVLIQFMSRLIKSSERKVSLILDNLKVHHSRAVKKRLETKKEQICFMRTLQNRPERVRNSFNFSSTVAGRRKRVTCCNYKDAL